MDRLLESVIASGRGGDGPISPGDGCVCIHPLDVVIRFVVQLDIKQLRDLVLVKKTGDSKSKCEIFIPS